MIVFDSTTPWKDRAFYFCGKLEQPIVAKVWFIRSEQEYDAESQPEILAMSLIRRCAKCLGKPPFLVFFSDGGRPSALRSKKGALCDNKELRQLPHIAFELACGHGETKLGAIVDLSDFSFDSCASYLLNWGRSLILLSSDSLSDLKLVVEKWTSKDRADVLAFDYDAIASSIHKSTGLGLMRYLPPSNSRREAIVVVAEKHFVDERARECIDAIAECSK
ncbi:MAG: hypothetical protein ACK5WR_16205 [Planctomycetaceae bacterium]